MSKTVDQRVVEMQFDNKHFERNVSTTMSTLDKLKQKLNLDGATKGLENINSAAGKVNMSGLGAGVEAVRTKFSALEVMGVTALANITNSAVNAGKRIAASLTIDPIRTGFNEYELKMGSIQTIMASTGEELDTVNKYLNELNEYSDKTIYSFQDMTSNIGKFTNAGVKLEDAVAAMKGISNEAAVSGANANEASRAMYNFAQALSAGYVKLIDWKSIELANMATVEFKEQLIETAVAAGTLTKAGDGMYKTLEGNVLSATKNFNETLTDQWMTSEVLISTLKKYADETTDIGAKATKAATEVKTFSQMMDALKESAQSGWAQTWEIIFGNFEEGKTLWTGINKVLDGMIGKMTDLRNNFLKGALTSKWEQLNEKIQKAGLSTEKFEEAIRDIVGAAKFDKIVKECGSLAKAIQKGKISVDTIRKAFQKLVGTTEDNVESMEDYAEIVKKVIRGDFGNGEERIKKLTEAGYDYAKVQNAVNEALGSTYRYTVELTEEQKKNADVLANLSDEQLKARGCTDEQIEALRELKRAAEDGGTSINDLIDDVDKLSGRELLIESFKNVFKEFCKILEAGKEAWKNVFGDKDASKAFYGIIEQLHKLTEEFTITEEQAKAFKTIIEGVLSGIELTWTIAGMSLRAGLKILDAVLQLFGTDILGLATYVAELIIKFNEWAQANTLIWGYVSNTAKVIHAFITGIYECIKAFWELEIVQTTIKTVGEALKKFFGGLDVIAAAGNVDKFVESINAAFEKLVAKIKKLDEIDATEMFEKIKNSTKNFGKDVLAACPPLAKLVEFFKSSYTSAKAWFETFKASPGVQKALSGIAKAFDKVRDRFKDAYEIGKNVIEGIVAGLKDGTMSIGTAIGTLITGLINTVKALLGINSPSKVFFAIGGFIIAGLIGGLMNGSSSITEALKTIGQVIIDFFSGLDFGKVVVAGTAIGSIVGMFLTIKKALDIADKFGDAAKGIGKLTGNLGDLVKTFNDGLIGKFKQSKWTAISNAVLRFAAAIGILALSVILMSKVPAKELWGSIGALAVIITVLAGAIVGLMAATKLITGSKNVDKIGGTLLKVVGAIAVMVLIAKMAAKMTPSEIKQGVAAISAFGLIIVGLMAATKLISGTKNVDKIGGTLFKISTAILLMLFVAKTAAKMTPAELRQGIDAISAFGILIIGFMTATKLISGSKNVDNIGGTLFKISAAILLMVLVAKMAAKMTNEELNRGFSAITAFGGLIVGLMAATKLISGSKNVGAIGGTLVKISGAIAIMVLTAKLAASMSVGEIVKGGLAIAAFGALIVGFMYVTKFVTGSKNLDKIGGEILKISGAIAIMMLTAKLAASMSVGEIIKGGLAVAAFGALIYAFLYFTKNLNGAGGIENAGKTLLFVAGAIAVMAASVALLSLIPLGDLAGATACLGVLMGMFALIVKAGSSANKSIGSLIVITVAVVAIAGALYLVGQLDPVSALASCAALSILMLTLAGVFAIVSTVGKSASSAIVGVVGMAALVALLYAVVGALALMDGLENAKGNAIGLSVLMLSLAAVLGVCTIVGAFAPAAAAGVLALAAIVVLLYAVVGAIALMGCIKDAETNTKLLISLLGMMTVMIGVLAIAGPAALTGVGAVAALVGLILAVGGLAVAIGALAENNPKLEDWLNTGIPLFEKVATKTGEMIGKFVNGIVTGADLPAVGEEIQKFMECINAIKIDNVDGITAAFDAVKVITEAAKNIDGQTSFGKWLTGDDSLSAFGAELATLGTYLNQFVTNLGEFGEGQIAAVKSAVSAVEALSGLAAADLSVASTYLPAFGENIVTFADDLSVFCEKVSAVSGLGSAVDNLKSLVSALIDVSSGNISAIKDLGSNLKKLGTNSIDKFISAFTSSSAKADVKTAAKELAESGIKGIESKEKAFKSAGESAAKKAVDGMDNFEDEAKSAGKDLGSGLVKGINAKKTAAYNAGYALGQAAVQGEKDGQQSNSPSKLTIQAGGWIGEGLVIGMKNMIGKVYSTGNNLGETATNSISSTISRIANAINSDIDAQPTIRPVLDLSDVRSGVGSINDMLAIGSSVGVAANVSAISSMMARRGQNGESSEVVSAINKLRKDLGNIGNTTYSINGVTYDDGSNVAAAVKEIARAAIRERRV